MTPSSEPAYSNASSGSLDNLVAEHLTGLAEALRAGGHDPVMGYILAFEELAKRIGEAKPSGLLRQLILRNAKDSLSANP